MTASAGISDVGSLDASTARSLSLTMYGRDPHSLTSLPRVRGGAGRCRGECPARPRQDTSIMASTIDLTRTRPSAAGRSRPSARTTRTSPSSASSRSSAASATRSATRCGACCCRRCAAPPSGASASTASCTSTRPSRASSRTCTRSSATSRRSTLTLADDVEDVVLRISQVRGRRRHGRRHRARRRRPRRRSAAPPLHAAGRPRHQRRAVREQGPRLRRGRPAPARSRPAGGPRPHRLDLQPGPPRELHGRRDARRPAHRLRPADADGRDQRHDLAGGSGELRRRARADALPVLRGLRLARVGAGRRRRGDAADGDARAARAAASARRSTTSSCRSAR